MGGGAIGWYGVRTFAGGVCRSALTCGKTAEETCSPRRSPRPCTRGPAPMISGVAAPREAPATRSASSRITSAVGKRSWGFFFSDRATSASSAGSTARLNSDGAGGASWTCW
jgi:hypothetical protein